MHITRLTAMKDDACISFLQWALPHMQMRWPGFRRVRGQVCKRLGRRLQELQLQDLMGYRMYLQDNPLEWHTLDSLCRITISRFYRDRGMYNFLAAEVFPGLLEKIETQGGKILACWCIGAASGEEPYSVSLLWDFAVFQKQSTEFQILATEVDQQMINRARKACYPSSSIRELPAFMKSRAFNQRERQFCLKEKFKKRVHFLQQDIRNTHPDATFHLIFCRNLVFTYFAQGLQEKIGQQIANRLMPGGILVIGAHEVLPATLAGLDRWLPAKSIYRKKVGI